MEDMFACIFKPRLYLALAQLSGIGHFACLMSHLQTWGWNCHILNEEQPKHTKSSLGCLMDPIYDCAQRYECNRLWIAVKSHHEKVCDDSSWWKWIEWTYSLLKFVIRTLNIATQKRKKNKLKFLFFPTLGVTHPLWTCFCLFVSTSD